MLRILTRVVAGLLILIALLVGGFRVWLEFQPEETTSGLSQVGAMEFATLLWHLVSPPSQLGAGAFDRRDIAGRGHSPWVLRSSLDHRPRMLHFALAPKLWATYSTERASLYQFWHGEIQWQGAVYDTRHGPEPESRGSAFLRLPDRAVWEFRLPDGRHEVAEVQYLGHQFYDDGARAALRFRLTRPGANLPEVVIEEEPETVLADERVGLARIFRRVGEAGEAMAVTLTLPPTSDGHQIESDGGRIDGDRLVLGPEQTRLTHWFQAPQIPLEQDQATGAIRAESLFEQSDCATCHGAHERVVGPGYREVAERYAGQDRKATVEALAQKILEGGVDAWGPVPMPAHPDLSANEARILVRAILDTPPGEPLPEALTRAGLEGTYSFDVLPRKDELHPSLSSRALLPKAFQPKVGGLALLPSGELLVATWDPDGVIFLVEGWNDDGGAPKVRRIAEGLHEPLGLTVVGDAIYVMQKQEVTQLIDHDGDRWIDEYRSLTQDWAVTSNFHEFGFGLVHREGWLYGTISACVLPGGKSCPEQTDDRGTAFRVSLEDGRFERIATGFRTPNGLGLHPDGSVLVTDNQGAWLPSSKLLRLEDDGFFGWRGPARENEPFPESIPPIVWLPQHEVGNSPTQPLVLAKGPYRGQILFGDVYNGGIKRVSTQEVGTVWQGAAFHFTGGLRGGVNRLVESAGGQLVAGEVGSTGNWADPTGLWYGLELLEFSDEPAFEPWSVEVTSAGLQIEFTRPVAATALPSDSVQLEQWRYIPARIYGGPKFDLRELTVEALELSQDRLRMLLEVPGLKVGHVVYLRLPAELRSERGEELWSREAWITVNAIPSPVGADLEDRMHILPSPELAPVLEEHFRRILAGGKPQNLPGGS